MVWGLPEGVGGAGWRGTKGENQDNCNSILIKIYFFKKEICKNVKEYHSNICFVK